MPIDDDVEIPAASFRLPGRLTVPAGSSGVVAFAHGSGSSRHSPRNRYVADTLNQAGMATLMFDLLTTAEEHDRQNVFDIATLADRLCAATTWLCSAPATSQLAIGYFGASTGAAAALRACAELPADISAVVSRGGRGDLAGAALAHVRAPTLLLVGELDQQVIELNRQTMAQLRGPCELRVVPGASHLFEESGALDAVAREAAAWFTTHLAVGQSAPGWNST